MFHYLGLPTSMISHLYLLLLYLYLSATEGKEGWFWPLAWPWHDLIVIPALNELYKIILQELSIADLLTLLGPRRWAESQSKIFKRSESNSLVIVLYE